jgi:hypothetical protein
MRLLIGIWSLLVALTQACHSGRPLPKTQPLGPTVPVVGNVAPAQTHATSPPSAERGKPTALDFVDPPLGQEVLPSEPDPTASAAITDETRAALRASRVAVPGLAPPPQSCQSRIVVPSRATDSRCADASTAWPLLADALEVGNVAARDRKLAWLERCTAFPHGLVRALRAELDPSCGDVILDPLLADPKLQVSNALATTLLGLVHAARLKRAVSTVPALKGATRPQDVRQFLQVKLAQWRDDHLQRLSALEASVHALPVDSYGQTIASLALATAWHELALGARRAPAPGSIIKDYELRTLYYGGSDDALESTSQHAVQLSIAAAALASRHGLRGSLIANAWHRVAAQSRRYPKLLSELLLPKAPETPAQTPRERIAYRLPSYYAPLLFSKQDLDDPRVVRGLIANGLAAAHRQHWKQHAPGDGIAELLVYGRVALARHTFDTIHLDEAIRLLQSIRVRVQGSPELQLLLGIATAARTATRSPHTVWDTTLSVTGCEPLQDLAEHCSVAYVRAFAFANQAVLRSLNASEDKALDIERLWGLARQAVTGTDAEACISYQAGFWLESRNQRHAVCTLADPL